MKDDYSISDTVPDSPITEAFNNEESDRITYTKEYENYEIVKTGIEQYMNLSQDTKISVTNSISSGVTEQSVSDYLDDLNYNYDKLYNNEIACYLKNEVAIRGEFKYFLYLRVANLNLDHEEDIFHIFRRSEKILRLFRSLDIDKLFRILLLEKTKKEIIFVSNTLFSSKELTGINDLIRNEADPYIEICIKEPQPVFYDNAFFKEIDRESYVWDETDPFFIEDELSFSEEDVETQIKIDIISWITQFKEFDDIRTNYKKFDKRIEKYIDIPLNILDSYFNTVNNKCNSSSIRIKSKSLIEKFPHVIEEINDREALSFRSTSCPACGKENPNAYAHPHKYTLKCFEPDCRAYVLNRGLQYKEWSNIEDSRKLEYDEKINSIQASREMINSALESKYDVLSKNTPGVGKTWAACNFVSNSDLGIIFFTFLNKKLRDEAFYEVSKLNKNNKNLVILESQSSLCLKKTQYKNAVDMGFSPSKILCNNCNEKNKCKIISLEPGIYFMTHKKLFYLQSNNIKPDLIIMDESISESIKTINTCHLTDLNPIKNLVSDNHGKIIECIMALYDSAHVQHSEVNFKYKSIINSRKITPDEYREPTILHLLSRKLCITEAYLQIVFFSMIEEINSFSDVDLYNRNISKKAILWIEGLVSKTSLSYFSVSSNKELENKIILKAPFENVPYKFLDATGDVSILEKFIGKEVQVVEDRISFPATYFHLKKAISRSLLNGFTDKTIKNFLKALIQIIKADNILVVCYKNQKKRVLKACKEINPQKNYHIHHFNGPRGINKYKNCDAVIIIGLPNPNISASRQDAHLLFPEDESKRELWIENLMINELKQVLHRIRPVNKKFSEICLVNKWWPSFLPDPNHIIDMSKDTSRVDRAYFILKPYVKLFGFLNQDLALLAGVGLVKFEKVSNKFRRKLYNNMKMFEKHNIFRMEGSKNILIKYIFNIYIHDYDLIKLIHNNLKKLNFYEEYPYQHYCNLTTSNNVFEEVKKKFKDDPSLEEFKIRSENSTNHNINGLGDKVHVDNFYRFLNKIGIFKRNWSDSFEYFNYVEKELPESVIVFYFKHKSKTSYIKYKNKIVTSITEEVLDYIHNNKKTILTNNYRCLINLLKKLNINYRNIIDICLVEKILRNGLPIPKVILTRHMFNWYNLPPKSVMGVDILNIYFIYKKQLESIKTNKLQNIINLEHRTLWVAVKMENKALSVDLNKLNLFKIDNKDKYREAAGKLTQKIKGDKIYIGRINNTMGQTGRMYIPITSTPKKMRDFLIPKEGHVFIKADYSQFEPRILSYISQDERSMDVFNSDGDIYKTFATEISSDPSESREIAKQIIISLNNGSTEYGVHDALSEIGIEKSIDDVRNLITLFHNLFPKFKTFQNNTVEIAKREGFIKTPLGRIRYFNNYEDFKTQNSIKLTSIQGIASDGFKIALCNIDKKLRDIAGAEIIMTIHDEIIVEVKDSQELIDEVKGIMKECMESAFNSFLPDAVFKVEFDVVNHW